MASLRLVAAGLSSGAYAAGVEIVMKSGSHTYWKQPGEAGVPPVFAFNGSQNVAKVEVRYPVPSRISEEGIEAFGYTNEVVFPAIVTPADPAKPVILKADVTYAVCNKICIPAHDVVTLQLAPGGAGVDAAKVQAALARVPVPAPESDKRALTIVADAEPRSWTLTWSGTPAIDDIFPAAPEGFYFATKKTGQNRFSLKADKGLGPAKTNRVPVSLTLARGEHSLVVTETLDVASGGE